MGLLDRNGNKPMSMEDFHNLAGIKAKDGEPHDRGIFIKEDNINELPTSIDPTKQKITREKIHESLSKEFNGADKNTLEEYTQMALALQLEDESQLDSFISDLVEKTKGLRIESIDTSAVSTEKIQNTNDSKDTSFVQKVPTPTATTDNHTKDKKDDLVNEGPEI